MKRMLVLPQPPGPVMEALLEDTCELAARLPHVQEARVLERRVGPQGRTWVRQRWCARARVPDLLQPHLEPGLEVWTLDIERFAGGSAARWQAESAAVQIPGRCRGTLDFAPALGDRGTIVTLLLEEGPGATRALATIFGALVERHWRALAEAAVARLEAATPRPPTG